MTESKGIVKIYLDNGVYEEHISEVIQAIHDADDNGNPIHLYISTLGGSVYECLALVDIIKDCKVPVTGVALGKVQSAGVPILAVCDYRKTYKHTCFMWHGVTISPEPQKLRDIKICYKVHRKQEKQLRKILSKHTKLKKKQIDKIIGSSIDWFFDSKEAKRIGLVDKII